MLFSWGWGVGGGGKKQTKQQQKNKNKKDNHKHGREKKAIYTTGGGWFFGLRLLCQDSSRASEIMLFGLQFGVSSFTDVIKRLQHQQKQ